MNNVLNIKLIEQLTAISDVESIDALIEQIYQAFDAQLDSFDSLVFYQAEDAVYRPILYYPSDVDKDAFLDIAQADVPAPLKNNQPNINKDNVYLGIHAQGQLLGILCFHITATEEQDHVHWVLIQNLLTLQFKDLLLDTQADSPQSKTLQEITVDKTFDEMAFSIARHMLPQKGRYVTINKLFYDEQGQVIEWGVVASANRNKIMTEQVTTTFPWKSLKDDTRKHILSGQILHVTKDTIADDNSSSSEKIREFFNQANVQSMHNFPIMSDGQVIAVLTLVNRNEQALTTEDQQTFTTICNQIGTVVFLRDQINQTSVIQELLRTMVDASYQISLAENDAEIITTLFTSMPEEVSHIGLYRFPTPITKDTHPTSTTLRVLASSNDILKSNETILFDKATFSTDLVHTLLAGQFVIESDIHAITDRLPSTLYGTLESSSIQAFILTGLRANDQLMGMVLIGTDKNISIDIGYHRNFRILADQIGITYENQLLLRRTEVSLMETQLQYAISNDLVQAQNLVAILRTLLQYFGEKADGAGIIQIDYDDMYQFKDAVITHQLNPDQDDVIEPNISMTNFIALDELAKLQVDWSRADVPVYFIENTETDESALPLDAFVQQDISSCILIPMIEDSRVTHVLSLNWKSSQTFPDRNRRLLTAVRSQLDIIYQNQQLLQSAQVTSTQLSQQVQVQRSLNELATFTGTVQDEKLLLEKGAETLQKIMNVDHVGIMLIEDNGQQAYLASEFPKRSQGEIRIRIPDDIMDTLMRGEYHIMADVTSEAEHIDSAAAVQSVNAKSSIFLPFRDLSGKLIGSVGLDQDSSGIILSDEQLQIAQLINAQIVSQLQNLRLLQDTQTLATQMQQVARFGETVQARLDLEEILQTSLHFIQRIFEADYIAIILYDETIEKLVVQASYLEGHEVVLPAVNVVMQADNTLAGAVWENRNPLYVSNLQDSDYSNPISSTIRAVYAVSLIARGVTRGVVEVGRTYNRGIRSVEQSVLLQLANQLTVALENTTTYIQSQRLAQNKVLANEISLQLQQQVDIDSLLNTTVTELGKALGAKRARIRLGIQQVAEKE